jgi:hypothetical protein
MMLKVKAGRLLVAGVRVEVMTASVVTIQGDLLRIAKVNNSIVTLVHVQQSFPQP